jgi:DNA-binding transcriptional LysR family regulator
VSAALNRLRHLFNDNLFVRQGNEMLPTPRAVELGERARLALAEIEGMIRSVRGLELGELDRTYTLLGADFFSMLLMPQLARRVHEQAPNVRLRLLDSARGDVARLLQENAVDMALERPLELPDWVSSALLFQSPFVIIASRNNEAIAAIPDGGQIPLDLFSRLPHAIRSIDGTLSGMVDEALKSHGLRRNVTLALPHSGRGARGCRRLACRGGARAVCESGQGAARPDGLRTANRCSRAAREPLLALPLRPGSSASVDAIADRDDGLGVGVPHLKASRRQAGQSRIAPAKSITVLYAMLTSGARPSNRKDMPAPIILAGAVDHLAA